MRRTLALPLLLLAAALVTAGCKKSQPAEPPPEPAAEVEGVEAPGGESEVEGAPAEGAEEAPAEGAEGDPEAEAASAEERAAELARVRMEEEKEAKDPEVQKEIAKVCNEMFDGIKKDRAKDKKPKGKLPPKADFVAACRKLTPNALRCLDPEFAKEQGDACTEYLASLPDETVGDFRKILAQIEGEPVEEASEAAKKEK